jgi:hypothetical protein
LPLRDFIHVPNAAANFTTSTGVNASPGFPPIVPRIPEIDFIKVTVKKFAKCTIYEE